MPTVEPSWFHAVTTHLPLVLLPLATLCALGGLLFPRTSLRMIAFGLLFIGFVGAVVAKETGEKAAGAARQENPAAHEIVLDSAIARTVADGNLMHTHAVFAEWTRNLYGGLFFVEAGLLAFHTGRISRWQLPKGLEYSLRGLWIIAALGGLALIVLTGHYGGLLVYEYGVGVNP